jgi:hypothetical protein
MLQEDSDSTNAQNLENLCTVWSLHESRWFDPGTLKSFLGFFSNQPRSFVDTFDPKIKRAVKDAVAQISPDVIVASTLGAVDYMPDSPNCPMVLEEHNCEYMVLKRDSGRAPNRMARLRREIGWRKFARWEAHICRRFNSVVMVSEQDKWLSCKMG